MNTRQDTKLSSKDGFTCSHRKATQIRNNLKLKQSTNSSDILVSFFFHVHLLFFYNKPVSNKIKTHIKMFLHNGFAKTRKKVKSGIKTYYTTY